MTLAALFAGPIRQIPSEQTGEWWDKPWETGFYKSPVLAPLWLGYEGLSADAQADRRFHGGVDKAVCCYPALHYPHWRATLPLAEMPFGAFGENFTLDHITEADICIGDTYRIGTATVQVSQPRQPCWKLARRWRVKDLTAQVERTGKTGFYFRVLQHGQVYPGAEFQLLDRSYPQWPITECNDLMHHREDDLEGARRLSECTALSGSWKDAFHRRAIRGNVSSQLS